MFAKIALAGQLAIAVSLACTGAWAQDAAWQVSKSSGDVWVASPGVQKVALTPAAVLSPGDYIRTGQNGRVLLVRGSESILISPNSAIGLPKQKSEGLSTTILQESGSILLEVEKRSEKHFEVETPYLVAVVKGTQFRVSVDGHESKVEVVSGQVEVAELKTGKFALVLPGQSAAVSVKGSGLSLSGSGILDEVKQGAPRTPKVTPSLIPANVVPKSNENASQGIRIKSALGEVKLDFQKVTKGIAHATTVARWTTVANNSDAAASTDGAGKSSSAVANGSGGGNGLGSGGGNGLGSGGGNGLGSGLVGGIGNLVTKGCKGKGSSC